MGVNSSQSRHSSESQSKSISRISLPLLQTISKFKRVAKISHVSIISGSHSTLALPYYFRENDLTQLARQE